MIKKTNKQRLVLFDAHAIIHRAYHALPEFSTSKGEPTGALYGLSSMLLKIIADLEPDFLAACFDLPGPTYRHEAYKEYKAGRVEADESLVRQLERAKDVFSAFGIEIYSQPGFEADDIIGTIVEKLKGNKHLEVIIATGDMDALQLVQGRKVRVYTLKKGINDVVIYDEERVKERFGFPPVFIVDYKGLRGDPSDNIVGVKGVGEKTATSLIRTFGSVEEIYRALEKGNKGYEKAGITERLKNILLENKEEALFSKALATIRTDAPINFILPKHWRKSLELEKLLELFKELEFRTMGERVKLLLDDKKASSSKNGTSETLFPENSSEAKELEVALWVLDSNITSPTMEDVFRFAKVKDVPGAKKVIDSELKRRKLKKLFEEVEKPIVSIVGEMNRRGVKIDKKKLRELSLKYHQELKKLEKAIWKEAGEEFNVNSPKVLSEILFEKLKLATKNQKKTSSGAFSTRESELEKLREAHPIISKVLSYREFAKLLSTYIDAIPPLLDKNSRLHSTFLQAGTTTGRMASTNPNLQNIPNRTELGRAIRHAFVAEKGFKLVSLDYSQIELRVAAILSRDKRLVEIFKNGEDVHAGVAMRVFKVPKEAVDKSMRIQAKTINFGILYGMGINALRANLGVSRKEAQEFYNEYFKTFSTLSDYLDKTKAEAARRGYTETLFGRRRYFAGMNSTLPYVRAQAERMAINAPIQGTQADLIKIAMKRIDDYIKTEEWSEDARLILQVHDELVYEIKNSLVEKASTKFKELMEDALPKDKNIGVPIVVDVQAGENWGEMADI